jgi:hypothetical protein
MKPATSLPWKLHGQDREIGSLDLNGAGDYAGAGYSDKDAAYIVHAGNNYPRMVEALRQLQTKADALIKANWIEDHGQKDVGEAWEACDKAAALIKELGE